MWTLPPAVVVAKGVSTQFKAANANDDDGKDIVAPIKRVHTQTALDD